MVRARFVAPAIVAGLILGAGIGHARMPNDLATLRSPESSAPYCMVDAEVPRFITVAGPAGGVITVDGEGVAILQRVDDDVADEAGPYDGILSNVPGPGTVAVDGKVCEPT